MTTDPTLDFVDQVIDELKELLERLEQRRQNLNGGEDAGDG